MFSSLYGAKYSYSLRPPLFVYRSYLGNSHIVAPNGAAAVITQQAPFFMVHLQIA